MTKHIKMDQKYFDDAAQYSGERHQKEAKANLYGKGALLWGMASNDWRRAARGTCNPFRKAVRLARQLGCYVRSLRPAPR